MTTAIDLSNIDFQVFGLFLEARRINRRKSEAAVAREVGIELDAVKRATRGRNPGADEFVALCGWMGEAPSLFHRRETANG